MAPIIKTSDERATRILDAAEVDYSLVEQGSTGLNPADYLLLEAKIGKEGYPDLWVCKYRLSADSSVQDAGSKIGLSNLQNTTQERNGRNYLGNITKEQALRLNLALGGRTQNLKIASDTFKLLLSGKAFDGNGKKIDKSESDSILDEITGVRSPGRDEWYEDSFTQGVGQLFLNKNYILDSESLVASYSKPLNTGLMQDKIPGIRLEHWVKQPTSQGLPRKGIREGALYYWHPKANFAAWFDADSDWASLYCDRVPQYSYSRLGVRHVREAPQKNN